MDLEQILNALKNLTTEEKNKISAALTDTPAEDSAGAETDPQSQPEVQGEGEKGEHANGIVSNGAESNADTDEPPVPEETPADGGEDSDGGSDNPPAETIAEPPAEQDGDGGSTAPIEDDPIPPMAKGEDSIEAGEVAEIIPPDQPPDAPSLMDEQGADMPVDYQQIVDGLNAKVMAIEAENKMLKAKVEGAFGLAGKPGGFAPVNKLYDSDTSDIPRMRR